MLIVEAIKHREQLVARAAKIVGNDAEDVVSEVMIYLMEGRFNASAEESSLRLLNWYVKNRCLDHLRKQKTQRLAVNQMRHEVEADRDECNAIDNLENQMRKLHPLLSRLLILHYAEGMTLPQLSKRINIKQSRIEYLIFQAKKQIKNGTTN